MKGSRLLNLVLTLIVLLAFSVGWAQAQEQKTDEEVQPRGGNAVAAILEDAIPIQGRLTDASGVHLLQAITASHSACMTTRLAGTLLCSTNYNPLPMTNGLFNVTVTGCTDTEINGSQLYLGVQVDADAEMTPRQPIYAVPYARSLRPGADIQGEVGASSILALYNTSTVDGSKGLYAEPLRAPVGSTMVYWRRSASPDGYGGILCQLCGITGLACMPKRATTMRQTWCWVGTMPPMTMVASTLILTYPGSDLLFVSNDRFHIHLDNNNDEDNSDFSILNGANTTVLKAEESGRLNLGINAGEAMTITVGDRYRDNAIVAWAKITGGVPGTIQAEFGISAVDHYATGCYKIYLDITAANAATLDPHGHRRN